MALGRPLHVFSARKGLTPIAVFSTTVPGATLVRNLSLAKALLPRNAGVLGVRFVAKVHNPNLGLHVFVLIGGAPGDHVGVASEEAVMTAEGLNTSPRLLVDISTLYAGGRPVEYLKLFAYYTSGGTGGIPNFDMQTMMFSGDTNPVRDALVVVPSTAPNEVGIDIDCVTDIDPQLSLAYGIRNLGNALLRRLITPRGSLLYDPDYGLDLRAYLNAGLSDGEVTGLAGAVALELEKDERVASAEASMTFIRQAGALRIRCKVDTVDLGSMTMLLQIGQVTATVLDTSVAA
jgi:hypothetical protein